MASKLKWLIVVQLLLAEQALCGLPPPVRSTSPPASNMEPQGVDKVVTGSKREGSSVEERVQAATRVLSWMAEKLQGKIQNHLRVPGSVSCGDLLSASTVDEPWSATLAQELLSLSLVPVLVVSGCPAEAQTLVLRLYDTLGVRDAEELLMEVEGLIEKKIRQKIALSGQASASASPLRKEIQAGHHIEGVMFNIQQLAMMGDSGRNRSASEQCQGWIKVRGSVLLGTPREETNNGLQGAKRACERLGSECAGVGRDGLLKYGRYRPVLRAGSRILPSESLESEIWIRQCSLGEDTMSSSVGRVKRSPQGSCVNQKEENVYSVVEWIPAVSTLYNLGTAMYYATINCTSTAKERAIVGAVDLGTDALMAATGGAAGVVGYALGAGVKTGVKAGVKYLLNSMREDEDLLVNQNSWEDGVMTMF